MSLDRSSGSRCKDGRAFFVFIVYVVLIAQTHISAMAFPVKSFYPILGHDTSSETDDYYHPPELPDDPFLIHAMKSLKLILNDETYSHSSRFTVSLYQHAFDVGDALEWENLVDSTDSYLMTLLIDSLSKYKETIPAKYRYEVVSMLADVRVWLENIESKEDTFVAYSNPYVLLTGVEGTIETNETKKKFGINDEEDSNFVL